MLPVLFEELGSVSFFLRLKVSLLKVYENDVPVEESRPHPSPLSNGEC